MIAKVIIIVILGTILVATENKVDEYSQIEFWGAEPTK